MLLFCVIYPLFYTEKHCTATPEKFVPRKSLFLSETDGTPNVEFFYSPSLLELRVGHCYTSFPDGKLEEAEKKLKPVKPIFTAAGTPQFYIAKLRKSIRWCLSRPVFTAAGSLQFYRATKLHKGFFIVPKKMESKKTAGYDQFEQVLRTRNLRRTANLLRLSRPVFTVRPTTIP